MLSRSLRQRTGKTALPAGLPTRRMPAHLAFAAGWASASAQNLVSNYSIIWRKRQPPRQGESRIFKKHILLFIYNIILPIFLKCDYFLAQSPPIKRDTRLIEQQNLSALHAAQAISLSEGVCSPVLCVKEQGPALPLSLSFGVCSHIFCLHAPAESTPEWQNGKTC